MIGALVEPLVTVAVLLGPLPVIRWAGQRWIGWE